MMFKRVVSSVLVSAIALTAFSGFSVYSAPSYVDEKPAPIIQYDFENNTLADIDAAFTVGASLEEDSEKSGKVLYLDGTAGSYMEFDAPKDENGNVLESYTVSFDVKNNTLGNYFNFYVGDGVGKSAGTNYLGVKAADTVLISTVDGTAWNEKKVNITSSGVQGYWAHFDIVVSDGVISVYIDDRLVGEMTGYTMKNIAASVIRFGFSAWTADNASRAYYDNIAVYDEALSKSAITGVASGPRPVESSDKLLFAMNFNNQNTDTVKGKAALTGDLTYVQSDDTTYAARFNGTGSYLTLTNEDGTPLLAGKDEVTITFHKKADSATSWWLYASPNNNSQEYGQEHYLGILDNGTKLTVERYHNSGTRNESPEYSYTQGLWNEVTVVVSKDKTTVYIDGREVSSKEYNFKLSDMLGSSPVTYIGRANWGNGEWATGVIDDIAIFDFAPDIELGDLSDIKEDIALPTASEETDGYSITWTSSDENTISSEGKVTIPESGKRKVTLTATISFGAHRLTKTFHAVVKAENYRDYTLDITAEKGVDIQDGMIGLFFEDINFAADGGLYAEMIENRSFEALKSIGGGATSYDGGYGWSAYPSTGSGASLVLASSGGLNANNTHYLNFTAADTQNGFTNQAYDGVYMEAGKTYNVSMFAKKGTFDGKVSAKVYSNNEIVAESVVTEALTDEWTKYETTLTPTKTVRKANFVVSIDGTGSACFDMVSCFPSDAVAGVFRRDLAEKLKAINPGFLRFPGGCVIEGYNLANRYNWKDSIGAVEERKQNWNRWSMHRDSGLDNGYKHYNQTYGLGYYEYFVLCEYLGAKAVPVVNVGIACQYQTGELVPVNSTEFQQYIQDALDLIEFANGDVTTTYGGIRAQMGHPEPFNLEIMGVGNEQWQTTANDWFTRYEKFEAAIHEKYPEMKLVGTSGPGVQDDSYNAAWSWIREKAKTNPNFVSVVDEHYYRTPDWFYENIRFYDSYDRNVKVFAGEYASRRRNEPNDPEANTWEAALSEAAYLTMVERNADVVYMASYAPLFARLNYTQWSPDMIWFNDVESYGSPTYYVQKLYGNNMGDYTLKTTLTELADVSSVFQNTSYDEESGEIIIKIANSGTDEQIVPLTIDESFALTGKVSFEQIAGDIMSVNSIADPTNISSERTVISDMTSNYELTLPAYSFTVIRIETDKGLENDVSVTDEYYDGSVVSFILNSAQDMPCVVYVAEYDADGLLVGVAVKEVEAGSAAEMILLSYKMKNKDNDLKLFIWDEQQRPVVESVTVKY